MSQDQIPKTRNRSNIVTSSIKTLKKDVCVLAAQSCLTLCNPMDCTLQAPPSVEFMEKNAGVGCHSFLQGIFWIQRSKPGLPHCRQILYRLSPREEEERKKKKGRKEGGREGRKKSNYHLWKEPCAWVCECSDLSNSVTHGLSTTRLLCPWNFPDKNTGVGCHFLLQGIFPIQGLNLGLLRLLHWQADSFTTVPPGKPIWCGELGIFKSYFITNVLVPGTREKCQFHWKVEEIKVQRGCWVFLKSNSTPKIFRP